MAWPRFCCLCRAIVLLQLGKCRVICSRFFDTSPSPLFFRVTILRPLISCHFDVGGGGGYVRRQYYDYPYHIIMMMAATATMPNLYVEGIHFVNGKKRMKNERSIFCWLKVGMEFIWFFYMIDFDLTSLQIYSTQELVLVIGTFLFCYGVRLQNKLTLTQSLFMNFEASGHKSRWYWIGPIIEHESCMYLWIIYQMHYFTT